MEKRHTGENQLTFDFILEVKKIYPGLVFKVEEMI